MKWLSINTALFLSTCFLIGAPAGDPPLGPPTGPGLAEVARSAGGDTLLYRFAWGAARGATGYQFRVYPIPFPAIPPSTTVGPIQGTWKTIPAAQPVALDSTRLEVRLINPAWDSVRFRAVVRSTRGATVSKDSTVVEWTVVRLGPPGPIIVDSTWLILGVEGHLVPDPGAPVVAGVVSKALCPVIVFQGGGRTMRAQDAGGPCHAIAQALPPVSPSQQAIANAATLAARPHRADASIVRVKS